MPVKLFGQYLIEQGEIDASQVRQALDLMHDENATIGQIAVRRGILEPFQAIEVSAAQRRRDARFGDLAVELGLLAPEQLTELLQHQQATRVPIGQALVRLGHLAHDRLGTLLDGFKADQAQYEIGQRSLPDALANVPVAPCLIELLPRFLMRVARIPAKVGSIRPFIGAPDFDEVRVSISLQSPRGLEAALVSDLEFAERLAIAASGLSPRDLDPEMVADGVGEFLNVLAANAVGAVARAGHRVELGSPIDDADLVEGWSVDLAVGSGRAALVLSVS